MTGGLSQRAVRHDGENARARRGLQHPVARSDHGSLHGSIGQRQGCGKLLQADLFLGTARVGRFKGSQSLQHRQHGGGTAGAGAGLAAHRHPVTLEEQDDGGFGGVVGVLPDPGALGVGAAERGGERVSQDGSGQGAAPGQLLHEGTGGAQQVDRFVAGHRGPERRRLRARGRARGRRIVHGRAPSGGWMAKGPAEGRRTRSPPVRTPPTEALPPFGGARDRGRRNIETQGICGCARGTIAGVQAPPMRTVSIIASTASSGTAQAAPHPLRLARQSCQEPSMRL